MLIINAVRMALIAMCLTVTMEVYPSSVNVQLEYFDRACSVHKVKSHTTKVYNVS